VNREIVKAPLMLPALKAGLPVTEPSASHPRRARVAALRHGGELVRSPLPIAGLLDPGGFRAVDAQQAAQVGW